MKSHGLKKLFQMIVALFFIGIALVWVGFYLRTTSFLKAESKQTIEQMSGQMIADLQSKFLTLDSATFTISQNASVRTLVKERDALLFHDKAGDTMGQIASTFSLSPFIENLIIFKKDNLSYYQMVGSLDQSSLSRIYYTIDSTKPVSYLVQSIDGAFYIGYVCDITEDGSRLGSVVVLTRESTLSSTFHSYGTPEAVKISLSASDTIISANDPSLVGESVETIKNEAGYFVSKKIGITPFEVVIFAGNEYLSAMGNTLAVAVVITALLFLALFMSLVFILNRNFFYPMFSVMKNVANYDSYRKSERLAPVGVNDFDQLIHGINGMLERNERYHMELLGTQMDAHFVVNTLHTIEILLQKNELSSAEQVTGGLTELLKHQHSGMSNVFTELSVLQHYIDIMNIRYHQKFTVTMDVSEELAEYVMQGFLLQPIIENAFTHGFSRKNTNCVVTLIGSLSDKNILFQITDNGIGIEPATLSQLQKKLEVAGANELPEQGLHGVALLNVQKRIQAKHGVLYGISIESELKKGTTVTICLPQIKEDMAIDQAD